MSTIFILYNAKASILGKLTYGYRKVCAKPDNPTCSACELTHGGLSLTESAEWKQAKSKIPAEVKQLHQDELTPELSGFVKDNQLKFPAVLGQKNSNPLVLLMTAEDLKPLSKNHNEFLKALETKVHENSLPWPDTSTQKL